MRLGEMFLPLIARMDRIGIIIDKIMKLDVKCINTSQLVL